MSDIEWCDQHQMWNTDCPCIEKREFAGVDRDAWINATYCKPHDSWTCAHEVVDENRESAEFIQRESADSESDSWAPMDLGPYLRGEIVRPTPTVGIGRTDGLRMLYPGKEHAVIGEMESGKSWFSLACVAIELASNHPVLYAHFEEADPSDTIERLLALGIRPHVIEKLFHFVAPERQVSSDALAKLLDPKPTLVVFDGVNEAMSMHRWGIREEDGAAQFRRHLVLPCTRAGAATLSCDHVVKDPEKRGRGAIGSVHKGNGISGSLIVLENAEPFGRGARGRSHVYVTKDRPGHLRRHGRHTKTPGKTFMGELVVDDLQTYTPDLELKFWAPSKEAGDVEAPITDDDDVLIAIKTLAQKGHDATLRAIRATAGVGKDKVDGALERLKIAGTITERPGPRQSRIFTVAKDQLSEGAQ